MPRKKRKKKTQKKKDKKPILSKNIKHIIVGMVLLLFFITTVFSFYSLAGEGGKWINEVLDLFFGRSSIFVPFLFLLSAIVYFCTKYENFILPLLISNLLLMTGISALLASVVNDPMEAGGSWGRIVGIPLVGLLGFAGHIIFLVFIATGVVIFLNLIYENFSLFAFLKNAFSRREDVDTSIVRKVFISSEKKEKKEKEEKRSPKIRQKDLPKLIPPFDLLRSDDDDPDPGDTKRNASIIKKTLSDFDIPVSMGEVNVGPAVTQYTLKPAEGVKLSRITSLANDLALSLAMHPVRTEAPIPGKSLVGIEVPNRRRAQITLGSLIENKDFFEFEAMLPIAVGRSVSGDPVYTDLAKMPHLLVAGSTGSGKTVFLNALLFSLIYKNSPESLRFIIVDPKRVDFSIFSGLPHLLSSIIYDVEKTSNALDWLIGEMERRFKVLSEVGSRNILAYREVCAKNPKLENMPYIVLVVDELADLMATKGNEIEGSIVRIAQMARAVGIHLVLATQRPSVEVITGLIKANITSRISFRVASQIDSRTVLDMAGAEKLLGLGDMLFISAENSKPRRIQAPYVSEKEAKKVIEWMKENAEKEEGDSLTEDLEESLDKSKEKGNWEEGEKDELYEDAKQVVTEAGKGSASLLQRRLRVGYARAARLLDMLEGRGVVGPPDGSKPRDVYADDNEEETFWEKT